MIKKENKRSKLTDELVDVVEDLCGNRDIFDEVHCACGGAVWRCGVVKRHIDVAGSNWGKYCGPRGSRGRSCGPGGRQGAALRHMTTQTQQSAGEGKVTF